MKKILAGITVVLLALLCFNGCEKAGQKEQQKESITNLSSMELSSTAFGNKEKIPSKYTCDGDEVSPPLKISNVPEDTKSLALISEDPDAPSGNWIHWVVWNIPPDTDEIPEGSLPSGAVEGVTSFGDNKYGGPCPPSGSHRYYFRLYALDTDIDLPVASGKEDLKDAMENHIIEQAELMGTYTRS